MRNKSLLILTGGILIYAVLSGYFSILRFNAFNAGYMDLGRMEQALWSIINGKLIINTFQYGNAPRFIAHFEGIFFLLAPLYSFFQDTRFLLILQSAALGLAALPLYLISREELKGNFPALIIALSYLLYPSLFYINLKDFHPDSLAILFIFSSFYFLLKKNWRWFWVFILLLIATREYYGLIVSALGVYTFFIERDRRRGKIMIFLGLVSFIVTFLILPRCFSQFHQWGDKIGPIPGSVFRGQGLVKNIAALFIPLAFLPLLKIRRILIALPVAGAAILLGKFSYANHHAAVLLPFVFLALIDYLKDKRGEKIKYGLLAIVIATIFANQLYGASPASIRFYRPGDFHYWKSEHHFKVTEHDHILNEFVELVPAGVRVTASDHIGAHLARREYINFFPYPEDLSAVDYVLVDLKEPPLAQWLNWSRQVERVRELLQDPQFVLVKETDKIYLFRRKI